MSFSQSMSKNEIGLLVLKGSDVEFFVILKYAKYQIYLMGKNVE